MEPEELINASVLANAFLPEHIRDAVKTHEQLLWEAMQRVIAAPKGTEEDVTRAIGDLLATRKASEEPHRTLPRAVRAELTGSGAGVRRAAPGRESG